MTKDKPALLLSAKAIDPALDALFSQSAGPVQPPPKTRYAELARKARQESEEKEEEKELEDVESEEEEDASENGEESSEVGSGDEEESEVSEGESDEEDVEDEGENESEPESEADNDDASESASAEEELVTPKAIEEAVLNGTTKEEGRKRKRKLRDEDENLEAAYLERLAREEKEEEERSAKRQKAVDGASLPKEIDEKKADGEADDKSSSGEIPVHEALQPGGTSEIQSELDKANRTVFLSNVSVEAIKDRKAKKILLKHLASPLDKKADPPQKIESIRFRSTPFGTTKIPRRVAYIKKEIMEGTTKSTNAYVVYSTAAAARLAVQHLNGTIVLDRHLRADSVAHPAPIDNRRCVFVGNLGFVDDESVYRTKVEDGKLVTEKKKKGKEPSDVEEGLWRVFGEHAGKVESVRVVRDPATRVGKGFAYVQFYDPNSVESALLLNGKSFPPLLPRELRVSRCKPPHKTARAIEAKQAKAALAAAEAKRKGKKGKGDDEPPTSAQYNPKLSAEAQTLAGRASKLLGKYNAERLVGVPAGKKSKKKEKKTKKAALDPEGAKALAAAVGVAEGKPVKTPEEFVFEGKRASAKDGKPRDLKFRPKKKAKDKVHGSKKSKKEKKKKAGKN
ncbi:uncharacterized protein CTHT_0073280 [Thermochaetoides thermophila DSM 1495]|uniref:RRM domain-containing protein n=1 Tax=Chaetomium thermophilum (strain DSM 1495 / CBS 144.50 / IMI 039719) TaxID=759272 RepID=G0SHT3_CHATD|nr:hypothetical protein CTHT_0073280 [Thermochaetoides thermophila DSM 1495]EGS17003.1 hypothetical protein CTHT_0073280 [Thermochaetoides thermophila DSM 1495]